MIARVMIAATAVVAATALPAKAEASAVSVMTWNVCASHNPECFFYGKSTEEVAWKVGWYAVNLPIKPDVILLQEFCSGGTATLEQWLEKKTGRSWTARSSIVMSADGTPKSCVADQKGRARGYLSVAVAVADNAATFQAHPLTSPSWYQKRTALCAAIPASKVNVCGTHLSAGLPFDDRQPGAPFRTKQVKELMAAAAKPGYRAIFGGDLNAVPPDSGQGKPAERKVLLPAYAAYSECDQGAGRTGRWTETHVRDDGGVTEVKLDYLFAPKGSVTQCIVEQQAASSDHKPLLVRVTL